MNYTGVTRGYFIIMLIPPPKVRVNIETVFFVYMFICITKQDYLNATVSIKIKITLGIKLLSRETPL